MAALHRVAAELVAPARKPQNEIALVATPGGFGTPRFEFDGVRRQVRVEGGELVQECGEQGERRAPLTSLAVGRRGDHRAAADRRRAERRAAGRSTPAPRGRSAPSTASATAILGRLRDGGRPGRRPEPRLSLARALRHRDRARLRSARHPRQLRLLARRRAARRALPLRRPLERPGRRRALERPRLLRRRAHLLGAARRRRPGGGGDGVLRRPPRGAGGAGERLSRASGRHGAHQSASCISITPEARRPARPLRGRR